MDLEFKQCLQLCLSMSLYDSRWEGEFVLGASGNRKGYLLSNCWGKGDSVRKGVQATMLQVDLSSECIYLQNKSHFLSNSEINV